MAKYLLSTHTGTDRSAGGDDQQRDEAAAQEAWRRLQEVEAESTDDGGKGDRAGEDPDEVETRIAERGDLRERICPPGRALGIGGDGDLDGWAAGLGEIDEAPTVFVAQQPQCREPRGGV